MTTLPQTTTVRLPQGPVSGSVVPGPMMGGAPGAAGMQMTGADVWRVIRSNLWLIVLLGVLSGAVGYGLNWWLLRKMPEYTAVGLLQVPGVAQTGVAGSEVRELPSDKIVNEQRTQVQAMQTERLFSELLQKQGGELRKTGWFKAFARTDAAGNVVEVNTRGAKQSLQKNLRITPVPDTSLLKVEMQWSNPQDARTVVEELVDLHLKQQAEIQRTRWDEQTKSLKAAQRLYSENLQRVTDRVLQKEADLSSRGGGAPGVVSMREIELREVLGQMLRTQTQFSEAKGEVEVLNEQEAAGSGIPELERLVDMNPMVQGYQSQLMGLQLQRQVEESAGTLPENAKMKKLNQMIEVYQKELEDTRKELQLRYKEQVLASARGKVRRLEVDYENMKKSVDALKRDLAADTATVSRMRIDQDDMRYWRDRYQTVTDKLNDVETAAGARSRLDWLPGGRPEVPESPSFPKLSVVMGLSIMVGLALAMGIAFLREFLDDTVRSPRDITRVGQLNVLGIVADENDDPQVADAKLPIFDAPHSVTAEQFRQVRTRLQHAASLDTMRSIMVTGPSPQDGKTTIAANLAAGLALNGRRILLVDANFRRPEIHRLFGVANDRGFSDVLNGTSQFEDVVQETRVPNLAILASGPKPMNAAELFESQLLVDFIERAAEEYDHVIFDSAPFLVVAEPGAMAAKVDGVVTVIRAHSESRGLLSRMRDALRQVKAEHVGVVLNAVRAQGGGYYGRNIKAYYQYQSEA